jgi:hypothetical protein
MGIIVGAAYKSSNGSPTWPGGGRVLDPKVGLFPDDVTGAVWCGDDFCAWSAGERTSSNIPAAYAGKERSNQEL